MLMPIFSSRFFLTTVRAATAVATLGAASLAAQPAGQAVPAEETRMSPETALKILLGDAAQNLLRPGAVVAEAVPALQRSDVVVPTSALKVVVKRGDTVEGLLRRHLADSVFNIKFQRQALMRLNPAVFQNGQVRRLEAGSTLWIPTDSIMMGLLPGARQETPVAQASTAPQQAPAEQDASATARQPVHTPSPSRAWVRFP
jgi:Tfp pilus assembly protein FimV